ncbi:replication initiation protein [Limobrevibacterium gyesilva]|uniref:Replication protein RepA n=1 Tax=Limobrevibacterium gyesilva TaxID=2991712 RepID=A0AA41YPK9_9PROT|nr:replication protein RepA [Limobrevibacterium gyesilva]MCW3473202.1 replication protein RepA [Limobrevibacterium gyesilva]
MDTLGGPRPSAATEALAPVSGDFFWHHPALCQLALPVRASSKGSWSRDIGTAAVTISAAGADAPPMPTGRSLRLLLIHLFSAAIRSASPVIDVGESPAALSRQMGLDIEGQKLRELSEQYERLAAAKIAVSIDGKASFTVFDGRGKARAAGLEWRPGIRLNSRFFESLTQSAVPLERAVVAALTDSVMALDAYAWVAYTLSCPQGSLVVPWERLLRQFGTAAAKMDDFRPAFEQSLQQVSAACPSVSLVFGADGVEVRQGGRDVRRARPVTSATPAPHPAPPQAPAAASATAASDADLPALPDMPAPEAERFPAIADRPAAGTDAPIDPDDDSAAELAGATLVGSEDGQVVRNGLAQKVSLKSHLTGLRQVIWLQRRSGNGEVVIEVTPGGRYDPENVTVLALEPIVVQIVGGLYARDFERVAAWANVNRDLIDDFWHGQIDSLEQMASRVRKVPAPGWR